MAAAASLAKADQAQSLRLVFWRIDFDTRGPGQALAQIIADRPNIMAMSQVIAALNPDILVLSGVDYDMQNHTLRALRNKIADAGPDFAHLYAPKPNAGFASGLDLNNDGWAHGPDDAFGYGDYSGARSLGVLSRHPMNLPALRDFTGFLWRDLPEALLYTGLDAPQAAQHRLSSVAHVDLPIILPDGVELSLLIYQAGPPVFGDHPDRNRNRNHDETTFWLHLLNDNLPMPAPRPPFVVIGGSNLDPFDGDGLNGAMRNLLAHPRVQDPQPASLGADAQRDPNHTGPARLDTVDWDAPQGNLRVAYILPSADATVTGAGVLWPSPDDPLQQLLAASGTAHKPVWVDILVN